MNSRFIGSFAAAVLTGAAFAALAPAVQQPAAGGAGQSAAAAQGSAAGPDLIAAMKALSPEEQVYFQHNVTLSNPFFEGRAPGLRGNELAAEYCEFYFKKLGLEPLFPQTELDSDDDAPPARVSYRQPFPAGKRIGIATQAVTVESESARPFKLEAWRDFVALSQSGTGAAEGEVAFVGYSIERAGDGYNTYADKDGKDFDESDLNGKIAMMLNYDPKDEKGKSKWVEGGTRRWSSSARLSTKVRRAVQRGAVGIIVVNAPGADDPAVDKLDDPRVPAVRRQQAIDVPAVMLSIPQAAELCKRAGKSLVELTKAADERGGVTPLKGPSVKIEVETRQDPIMTDNVAAVLPGKGELAGEYVIIGGHYDHVGYGAFGSRDSSGNGKLHPGADDNASGASGVLLAADIMSKQYKALPKDASTRSVIFMTYSAEEGGLIGSNFFVKHSPVAASATYAMLNMDMIGRLREDRGLEVSGTGTAEGFGDLIKPQLDAFGGKVRTAPGGSGPSDHASFYRGGVPVLAFFTGLHREYHMPTDVFTHINTPGAVKVVQLCCDIAIMLAARAEPLVFVRPTGPSVTREGMAIGDEAPPSPGAGPSKVRFGIAPASYADDEPTGVGVGDVYEGTSAADAGIKIGDRLIRWNGEEVKDVAGWMSQLAAAKPGDIVHVVVKRGAEEITLPVTLKARETEEK